MKNITPLVTYFILYNCDNNLVHFFKGLGIYFVSFLFFINYSVTNIAKDINVYFVQLSVILLIINTIVSILH